MASKFSMVHENIEQQHYAQMDAEDKMAGAMNDLRVKASNQERERRDVQRYEEQAQWDQKARPEMENPNPRFPGDDAGYMVADHPAEHVDIHELHHGDNQELGRNNPNGSDSDSDDEFDDLLDDPDVLKIRNKRLNELRSEQDHRKELLAKGHGTYNEVVEENFLKEVCNAAAMSAEDKFGYQNSEDDSGKSGFVICHFFHKDFEKCKVIDMHLRRMAHQHIESKFIRVNAEKTPFFVDKLRIRVLPCIIVFNNGVACPEEERIMGYEGLADGMPEDKKDEFPMSKLQERLADIGCIKYFPPSAEMEEEMKERGGSIFGGSTFDTEFDDDES